MRGHKAKQIMKQVRQRSAAAFASSVVEVAYSETKSNRQGTITLDPRCIRSQYQKVKRAIVRG